MLVPKGPLLLFCYALISLSLPLPAGGSALLFIFCLSDLCVDGIHLALVLYITLETSSYCLVQLLKHKPH